MSVAVASEAFGDCCDTHTDLLSTACEASSPWITVGGDSNNRAAVLTIREGIVPNAIRHPVHCHRIGGGWRWLLPGELVRARRGQAERLSVHLDAVKKDINLGIGAPRSACVPCHRPVANDRSTSPAPTQSRSR